MASSSGHLAQWQHNRELIPLIPRRYTDWIVTVSFYTALHAVDYLLSKDGVSTIVDHRSRNSVLLTTNKYNFICKRYLQLFDLSQTVRYLAEPAAWVPFNKIESDVFGRYLYPIEESVRRLSGNTEAPQAPITIDPA